MCVVHFRSEDPGRIGERDGVVIFILQALITVLIFLSIVNSLLIFFTVFSLVNNAQMLTVRRRGRSSLTGRTAGKLTAPSVCLSGTPPYHVSEKVLLMCAH